MSPFDIIKTFQDKSGFPLDTELDEKQYVPFVINKGLSFEQSYVAYADIMNTYPDLPARMQCQFYYNVLPKGKKYSKWLKSEADGNEATVLLIQNYFSINKKLAEQYCQLLNDEQIEIIRKRSDQGGRSRA